MKDGTRVEVKVYVAAGFEERHVAAHWIGRLRAEGVEVTHDWTAVEEASGDRLAYAAADSWGVVKAHLLWLLAPAEKGQGCWTEMGIALCHGSPVIVSGAGRSTAARWLAAARYATHDEAFADIIRRST